MVAGNAEIAQRLAGHHFRLAGVVHIRCVDKIDPTVESASHDTIHIALLELSDLGKDAARVADVMVPRHSSETSRPVLPSFFMRMMLTFRCKRSDYSRRADIPISGPSLPANLRICHAIRLGRRANWQISRRRGNTAPPVRTDYKECVS